MSASVGGISGSLRGEYKNLVYERAEIVRNNMLREYQARIRIENDTMNGRFSESLNRGEGVFPGFNREMVGEISERVIAEMSRARYQEFDKTLVAKVKEVAEKIFTELFDRGLSDEVIQKAMSDNFRSPENLDRRLAEELKTVTDQHAREQIEGFRGLLGQNWGGLTEHFRSLIEGGPERLAENLSGMGENLSRMFEAFSRNTLFQRGLEMFHNVFEYLSELDSIKKAKILGDAQERGVENAEDIYNWVEEREKFLLENENKLSLREEKCCITQRKIFDPVKLDSIPYERSALLKWILISGKHPINTNEEISNETMQQIYEGRKRKLKSICMCYIACNYYFLNLLSQLSAIEKK